VLAGRELLPQSSDQRLKHRDPLRLDSDHRITRTFLRRIRHSPQSSRTRGGSSYVLQMHTLSGERIRARRSM
jgi:hypothetical protein